MGFLLSYQRPAVHTKRSNIKKLVNFFHSSGAYLMENIGDPFPFGIPQRDDLLKKSLDIKETPPLKEQQKEYKKQDITKHTTRPTDFILGEAVGMATEVLSSGTSYATALYLNIQHFDRAIRAENRICFLEQENVGLKDRIDQLEARLAALEEKLSRDPEGDPPGSEAASVAPTGTNRI
jgi:hypothetical protein